jgi:nucleolar protein 56
MRLKEWFSWHFPELSKIVTDNHIYTKIVQVIGIRDNITDDMKEKFEEILNDEEKA